MFSIKFPGPEFFSVFFSRRFLPMLAWKTRSLKYEAKHWAITYKIAKLESRFGTKQFYILSTRFQSCLYMIGNDWPHCAFKWHKSNIKTLLMKSSEIVFIFLLAFYLIIWLMTSPKNSEKISILKMWQLVFFWGVKTYIDILPLKWCIFSYGKDWVSKILSSNTYFFH